jgi:hypothetical protein
MGRSVVRVIDYSSSGTAVRAARVCGYGGPTGAGIWDQVHRLFIRPHIHRSKVQRVIRSACQRQLYH